MKTADEIFSELESFWLSAYAKAAFDLTESGIARSCRALVHGALSQEGAHVHHLLAPDEVTSKRAPFTAKLPEPFFGRWRGPSGALDLSGKTVVVLINPGDGVTYQAYLQPEISALEQPIPLLFQQYYLRGHLDAQSRHALLYKRALRSPGFHYVDEGRRFAWGWWATQFENMLGALNYSADQEEEDVFVTLELFAYSSRNANHLDAGLVSQLRSSQLVVQLVQALSEMPTERAPTRAVLVNKGNLWEPLLENGQTRFAPLDVNDRRGKQRAFCLQHQSVFTSVPVILLNESSMRFPRGEAAQRIFASRLAQRSTDAA